MIRLICNTCKTENVREDSEVPFECVSTEERQMGAENMFSGTIEMDCQNCGSHLAVEFNFWEYPVLSLNYSEYSEEGCVVVEEPDYQAYLQSNEQDNED